MNEKIFTPSSKFKTKMFLSLTLIALAILLGSILFLALISLDRSTRFSGIVIAFFVCLGVDVLWYIPGMLLVIPYYNSLKYEIHEDEVIVNAGIITKTVKHVPFRTITNLTVRRGILDRLLGIGSLQVQTAGASDSSGAPEESLVGMENVQEIYELIAAELRRFRSGMAPTAASTEPPVEGSAQETLAAILVELKAIREKLAE